MENSSIKVKLLANGKYTWDITIVFDKSLATAEAIALDAKSIDSQLRDKFPNHVLPGNSRTVELE